jgi:hypothetical protein
MAEFGIIPIETDKETDKIPLKRQSKQSERFQLKG